jgi:hypothetical protein
MAKKNNNGIAKVVQPAMMPIVLQPRDLSSKTLDNWKNARAAAESIYNPIRKPLMDLYRDVVLDPHASSLADKRIMQITNISWTFSVDGKPYEPLAELTERYFFEQLIRFTLESKLWGSSLIEIDFRKQTCELVPREHVVGELGAVLPLPYSVSEGIDYTKPPYNRTTVFVGELWDLGLLYKVAPYVLLKKHDVSDWATFCEVFGMPSRVYYYDPNIPGNYDSVTSQAEQTGSNAWAVLPLGSDMKQESNTGKQGNDVYKMLADFCNAEMSKAIVGQTMTTENGSSRSQAEVHANVEDGINAADRRFVERTLNEKIIPLMRLQGFDIPEKGKFHAIDQEEELSKKDQLDMDLRIHKEVGALPQDYFAEKYNVTFDPNAKSPQEIEAEKLKVESKISKVAKTVATAKPLPKKAKLKDRLNNFLDFFQ